MGHSISYDEVNLMETKLADDQARMISREFVPTNIQPSLFVTFVYANCDHNMESIYGATLHCTNWIIIQVKKNGTNRNSIFQDSVMTNRQIVPVQTLHRKRSYRPTSTELPPCYKKQRQEPNSIPDIDLMTNELDGMISRIDDMVHYFSRYYISKSGDKQCFPSWKGFFSLVTDSN